MNEGLPLDNKEKFLGEKEAKELGDSIDVASEQLNAIDESKVTPEQFKALEGQVDIIFAILAAYAGVQMISWGINSSVGSLNSSVIENMLKTIKVMAASGVGMTLVYGAWINFCKGLKKFTDNTPH